MCIPSARHAIRLVGEGEGFGVETFGFEVLMNFSEARDAGRGSGKRKVAAGFG